MVIFVRADVALGSASEARSTCLPATLSARRASSAALVLSGRIALYANHAAGDASLRSRCSLLPLGGSYFGGNREEASGMKQAGAVSAR